MIFVDTFEGKKLKAVPVMGTALFFPPLKLSFKKGFHRQSVIHQLF
jgi:hypothetical protein